MTIMPTDRPIPDALKCPKCGELLLVGRRDLACPNLHGPIVTATQEHRWAKRRTKSRRSEDRFSELPIATCLLNPDNYSGMRFLRLLCDARGRTYPHNAWRFVYTIAGKDGLWRQTTTSVDFEAANEVVAIIPGRGRRVFAPAVEANNTGGE